MKAIAGVFFKLHRWIHFSFLIVLSKYNVKWLVIKSVLALSVKSTSADIGA